MKRGYTFLMLLLTGVPFMLQAQQCRISGTVRDAKSGEPLGFAHIFVKRLNAGTTSDAKGRFTMPIDCGEHTVRASYMGYESATKIVNAADTSARLDFALMPSTIVFPEITVVPGENPAIPIIRKAIAAKRKVEESLQSYQADAHTKLRAGNAVILAEGFDAHSLEEAGVLIVMETHSTAYWSREGGVKEVIRARKHAVMGGEVYNILNSMPARTNFSADIIRVGQKDVTGPISEEGLDDYWYELLGTTEYDGQKVYKIGVHPESELAPRMDGTIYITDSTYLLMLVDAGFTEPVFGHYLSGARFRQQFTNADGFWMPADVAITGTFEGAIAVKFTIDVELFSVLKDYKMNAEGVDEKIGDYIIEVERTADDMDSAAWKQASFIPRADDEVHVYSITDSVTQVQTERRQEYGVGGGLVGKELKFGETTYDLPGAFSIYRFNKVEGHAFDLGFGVGKPFALLERADASAGYGFSDERWKWSIGAELELHQESDLMLRMGAFDKLAYIDEKGYVLGAFPGLLAQAAFLYDPRDFYYQKGYTAEAGIYALPMIHVEVRGALNKYSSSATNTDEHLFRANRAWPENPPINDGTITSAGLRLFYNSGVRILNKGAVERWGGEDFRPVLDIETNMADIAGEEWAFTIATAALSGEFGLGGWGEMRYNLDGSMADNRLPTQRLLNLTGSTEGVTGPWLFRSALPREFGGDARATAMAHWDLGNLPLRAIGMPNIPYLNTMMWEFTIFGNAGWTDMRDATAALQTFPTAAARTPFYEMGFSVGNIFSMLQFDFAWRMNHFRDGANFFWGISISPGSILGK